MSNVSISPAGEQFPIPQENEYAPEMERLEKLTQAARDEGKEIVVVMGVGFVGAVMAAIIADTVDKSTGKPSKFVIGCQRPSTRSYWKIPLLNRGESPVKAEDPEVDPMIVRCVKEKKTLTAIRFALGLEHAAYVALDAKLGPPRHPYGWYVRVPDLPGFIRHIAPVLEKRLVASVMDGFSGELNITFYRGGVHLAFARDKLTDVTDWSAPETNVRWDGAGFPPLVFLQLLFGHRSLDELRYAFPDCWADEEPALLLNTLFPKRVSWVIPLG